MATFTLRKIVEIECFAEIEANNVDEALRIARDEGIYDWDESESLVTYMELYMDDEDNEYNIELDPDTCKVKVAKPSAEDLNTKCDLFITDYGTEKLTVVRTVKDTCGLSLMEAKKIVDNCPSKLKEGISKFDAENLKKIIEKSGATVELQNFSK